MKLGDKIGLDKYYDCSGLMIMEDNETLFEQFQGKLRSWIGKYPSGLEKFKFVQLELSVSGMFNITNRRLVFIGLPVPNRQGFFAGGGMASTSPNYQYMKGIEKNLTEQNSRLFFTVPISKILKVNNKGAYPDMVVEHKGTNITFELEADSANNLNEILEKLVKKS